MRNSIDEKHHNHQQVEIMGMPNEMIIDLKEVREMLKDAGDFLSDYHVQQAIITIDHIIAESDKCPDCGAPMVLECSGLNHTLSMLSAAPTPAPVDQSKYPYDRSEYVVMPPIRKAEDGTLTTEKLDVESLKKPIPALDYDDSPYLNGLDEGNAKGWNDCIDHLAASGYFRAPLPRIEGLAKVIEDAEWSFRTAEGDETYAVKYSDLFALIKAARAYLKHMED